MDEEMRNLFQDGKSSGKENFMKRNLFRGSAELERKKAARRALFRLWHFIFIIMGIAILIFRYHIEISPQKMEYGYSRAIYPHIAAALSLPGRWVPAPYSASELFCCLLFFATVSWFCYNFYILICRKKSIPLFVLKIAIYMIVIAAGGYFFYLTSWGFNYLREPFSLSLNLDDPSILSESDYERMANDMLSLINNLCQTNCYPPHIEEVWEMDRMVDRAVKKIIDMNLSVRIPSPPPTKFLFTNECLNAFGISGFFSPLFMEPHLNSDLLLWEQPHIMAHEKAHFMGFASETDANFIAYLACLISDSDMLRYSAALNVLLSISRYMPYEKWRKLVKGLPQQVRQDIKARNARLRRNQKHYPRLLRAGQKVNDTYLKLNSQKLGIKSYQAAMPHLVVWWKKQRMVLF